MKVLYAIIVEANSIRAIKNRTDWNLCNYLDWNDYQERRKHNKLKIS